LVVLQRLQNNLELGLMVPTSSCLISQLLRYGILTANRFLHRPLELLAPSLDLPKRHLQISNLLLVLQGGVKLLFTVAEAYETSQLAYHKKTSFLLNKITNMKVRATNGYSIELRSSLHGLALLLGKIILEPLLLGSRRLTDMLDLLLKVCDLLLPLHCVLQQVDPAFGPFC
jgi:hypothetical protein